MRNPKGSTPQFHCLTCSGFDVTHYTFSPPFTPHVFVQYMELLLKFIVVHGIVQSMSQRSAMDKRWVERDHPEAHTFSGASDIVQVSLALNLFMITTQLHIVF